MRALTHCPLIRSLSPPAPRSPQLQLNFSSFEGGRPSPAPAPAVPLPPAASFLCCGCATGVLGVRRRVRPPGAPLLGPDGGGGRGGRPRCFPCLAISEARRAARSGRRRAQAPPEALGAAGRGRTPGGSSRPRSPPWAPVGRAVLPGTPPTAPSSAAGPSRGLWLALVITLVWGETTGNGRGSQSEQPRPVSAVPAAERRSWWRGYPRAGVQLSRLALVGVCSRSPFAGTPRSARPRPSVLRAPQAPSCLPCFPPRWARTLSPLRKTRDTPGTVSSQLHFVLLGLGYRVQNSFVFIFVF